MKTRILDFIVGLVGIGFALFFIFNIVLDLYETIQSFGLYWYDIKFYLILIALTAVILYASLRLIIKAIIFFKNDYMVKHDEEI